MRLLLFSSKRRILPRCNALNDKPDRNLRAQARCLHFRGVTAIRAALFDVDGTLLDSNELHVKAWRRAFADFDIPVSLRALREQMGNRGDRLAAALCPPGAADELARKLVQRHSDIFARDYLHRVRPFPGVRRLFNRLRADGVRVVLASSQEWERDRHIGILGVRGLVEEDALAAPRDTIAVGDSPYDALAARQAGMQAIGVLTGSFDKRTLWDAGARYVYRDIADLLERYESSPLVILDDGDDDEPPGAPQPAVSARRESPSAGPRYR